MAQPIASDGDTLVDKKVSFLIAGAQKCGTSALFHYLRQVPQLLLPKQKELHYFDDHFLDRDFNTSSSLHVDWQKPDYRPYHAVFKEVPDSVIRLWGEATPIYMYWPPCLERIHAYNPMMKIILLFRNPVLRAWSQWKMEYSRGKETEKFSWCIRAGRRRMRKATPYPGYHRVYSYVERGFYSAQLQRVYEFFPKSQVLLLRTTDLKHNPDATVSQVCRFIGIPAPAKPLPRAEINTARTDIHYPSQLRESDIRYLNKIFKEDQAAFPLRLT